MKHFWKMVLGATFLLVICAFPSHAQQIELACPVGTQPIQGGGATTINQVTGGIRRNWCVDVRGNLTAQTQVAVTGKLNGICIVDGSTNATLAAAVTCAGATGVIEISMFAVPALTTSVTIPVGVTLRFDGPSGITTTGFTLTINGPLVAPPVQIFFGTGTVAIGANTPVLYPNWFPGADICVQSNAAYAAMQSPGATILVPPSTAAYNCATPNTPSFSTLGKPVVWDLNGQTINYTFTGGTSGAITAISEAGSIVTATSALNPGIGVKVCVSGYAAPADAYNGCFIAATSSGANFTYNNAITGLAGAGAGTAQLTQTGAIIDYGLSTGSSYTYAGIRNGFLFNTSCITAGGCGNATIGVSIGPVNGGGGQLTFTSLRQSGWGVAQQVNNGASWGLQYFNYVADFNTFGWQSTTGIETANFTGGLFASNTRAADIATGAAVKFSDIHFDSNTVMGISTIGTGLVTVSLPHFENLIAGPSGGTTHYYFGSQDLSILGGDALDDNAVGNTDYWFTGNGQIQIFGLRIGTSGRTATNIAACNVTCEVHFLNASSGTLTGACVAFNTVTCSQTPVGGGTPFTNTPQLGLSTSGGRYILTGTAGDGGHTGTMPTLSGTLPAGVFSAAGTAQTSAVHIVQDTATLAAGTVTITLTGAAVFANATSYTCVADDDTAIGATRVLQSSGSSITITGTGTDVIRYICVGN